MKLKPDAPSRDATEVGAGDYLLDGSEWKLIRSNTAEGMNKEPSSWIIVTHDGKKHGRPSGNKLAKAEDMDP